MALNIAPEIEERVFQKVRSGSFASPDDVIREGLALIDAREEFRNAVQVGIQQADHGELLDGEQVFADVEAELKASKTRGA